MLGGMFLLTVQKCLQPPAAPMLGPLSDIWHQGLLGACFFDDAGVGLMYYGAFRNFMPNGSITVTLSAQERFPAGSQR